MSLPAERAVKPADRRRTIAVAAVKLLVSLAAFWLVLRTVDFSDVLRQFSAADPTWMALALASLIVHFGLVVWRWDYVLVRFYHLRLGLRRLSLVLGLGEALGPALPTFVGMDVVRTLALTGTVPLITIARAVAVDRVIGLVALLVLIALSLPFFAWRVSSGPAFLIVGAIGVGGLAAYCIGLQTGPILARIPTLGAGLATMIVDLRRVSYDGRAMAVLIVSGLAVQVSSVSIFWCTARMLGGTLDVVSCLLIMPPALLIASIPISLGGWGVREGALVAGFALVGADSENVLAASICFGLSGIVSGVIGIAAWPLLPRAAAAGRTSP